MPVVLGRVGSDQSCRGVVSAGRIGSGRIGSGRVGLVLSGSRVGSGRVGLVLSGSRECRSCWVGSYWVGSGRTSRVGES